jgi:hypothetical protein
MSDPVCKCCGQILPQPLRIDTLSTSQRYIVDTILKAGENGIDARILLDVTYADDPNGGPLTANNSLRVRIHKINRKHLIPAGYMIKANRGGNGCFGRYRIVKCEVPA